MTGLRKRLLQEARAMARKKTYTKQMATPVFKNTPLPLRRILLLGLEVSYLKFIHYFSAKNGTIYCFR